MYFYNCLEKIKSILLNMYVKSLIKENGSDIVIFG